MELIFLEGSHHWGEVKGRLPRCPALVRHPQREDLILAIVEDKSVSGSFGSEDIALKYWWQQRGFNGCFGLSWEGFSAWIQKKSVCNSGTISQEEAMQAISLSICLRLCLLLFSLLEGIQKSVFLILSLSGFGIHVNAVP